MNDLIDPGPSMAADILILANEEATAGRWAGMLAGPRNRIWLAADDLPEHSQLDLIIVDHNPKGRDPLRGCPGPGGRRMDMFSKDIQSGGTGVIRIGCPGPADVWLPADVTERELRLACRLLTQIVRYRRQQRTRAKVHSRLAREAFTDPVSGLPNRRAWDQALRQRLATAGASPERLCVAIFDLDHFKRINDAHGHAIGDQVLRAAASAISGGLRKDDFVARLGGDEFGLLLSVPNQATAAAVVDRVRMRLPASLAQSTSDVVTASAGFHVVCTSDCNTPLPSPESVFTAADTALREAKRQGRDRTVGSATN